MFLRCLRRSPRLSAFGLRCETKLNQRSHDTFLLWYNPRVVSVNTNYNQSKIEKGLVENSRSLVSRVHPEEWRTRHGERLLILVCGWHVQQASRRYCFCPHHASPDLESVPANIIHEQLLVVCFSVLPCFGSPLKECIIQVLLSTLQAALLCQLMAMKTSQ